MSKRFLVIGGANGVGRALAAKLTEAGSVCVTSRSDEKLAEVKSVLSVDTIKADATDTEAFTAAVEGAAADGLDGLAYCAGSIDLKPLRRASAEDFAAAYALNVIGAAMAVKAAAPALKKSEGGVLLFSTVAAHQGFQNHSVIAAAKGGVEGLTLSLASELSPAVRVNCLALSLTKTPLSEQVRGNDQMEKALGEAHPLRRLGEPEDPAALGAFLLSHDASWITGQIIGVDGGRATLRPKG